jgi:hypothetical protein
MFSTPVRAFYPREKHFSTALSIPRHTRAASKRPPPDQRLPSQKTPREYLLSVQRSGESKAGSPLVWTLARDTRQRLLTGVCAMQACPAPPATAVQVQSLWCRRHVQEWGHIKCVRGGQAASFRSLRGLGLCVADHDAATYRCVCSPACGLEAASRRFPIALPEYCHLGPREGRIRQFSKGA